MLKDFLVQIGFSEKEAKVYLALLEVDHDSIADLSKKTGIKRTTVYPVLDYLKEKGLVKEITIKGKQCYQAESPERLETFVEEKKLQLNEQSNKIKDMIPQFKGIMRESGERPIVEFYEGREAIISAAKKKLMDESGDYTYMIYPRDAVEGFFTKKELEPLRALRINKKLKTKSIYTYTKGDYNPDGTSERFHVDEKKYPIKAEINVSGDKINMYSLGENPNSIFIQSKDAADTLKALFEIAFEGLKKNKDSSGK
jgi:sugar-specific transcriptional regulator TrmB